MERDTSRFGDACGRVGDRGSDPANAPHSKQGDVKDVGQKSHAYDRQHRGSRPNSPRGPIPPKLPSERSRDPSVVAGRHRKFYKSQRHDPADQKTAPNPNARVVASDGVDVWLHFVESVANPQVRQKNSEGADWKQHEQNAQEQVQARVVEQKVRSGVPGLGKGSNDETAGAKVERRIALIRCLVDLHPPVHQDGIPIVAVPAVVFAKTTDNPDSLGSPVKRGTFVSESPGGTPRVRGDPRWIDVTVV